MRPEELQIEKINYIDRLDTLQNMYLECLLMPNNEIMFLGRSLGFFKEDEIKKCGYIAKGKKDEQILQIGQQTAN